MANTQAAIMALPGPLEQIRLVGDEDKHATLLYFGETNSLPDDAKQTLVDAVALASTMLMPFGESIQTVQRLGPENPPALVAMLSNRNLGSIRSLFMMNPAVKGYLDNTDQFPQFTPHVTLGFPDFAEEALLRALAQRLYTVRFTQLSVWWNDERFDVALQGNGDAQNSETVMAQAIEEFLVEHGEEDPDHLEHHGVKGQKWGVRRPVSTSTGLVARTSSADQIHQDRIASKIAKGGTHSVSNKDIQDFTRRLQLQQDLDRALSKQAAETKIKADGFIKRFVKNQGSRQIDRVVSKALDIAVEEALSKAGIKASGGKLGIKDFVSKSDFNAGGKKLKDGQQVSKSEFGDNLQVLSSRIKPKKK